MKLIVDLDLFALLHRRTCTLCKEFDTDLVPGVGMALDDPAWENPRPIEHLAINPS